MTGFPIIFEINADAVREAIEAGANLRVEVKSFEHHKVTVVRRPKCHPQPIAVAKRRAA